MNCNSFHRCKLSLMVTTINLWSKHIKHYAGPLFTRKINTKSTIHNRLLLVLPFDVKQMNRE
ncbi:CLUMA_CG019163, isoform A [Clunio marinus]|uniref:CLUMA_CG019163, isoform A n=1 Tax=Clunio marinus TaxID=568069 RepID=A0A1J1J399_9DIPT|nr:CLUMA_CG019163, isoform A [Clunio marinus]